MKNFHAYTVSLNGVVKYVGITTRGVAKRWSDHRAAKGSKSSRPLGRAIKEHGVQSLSVEHVASSWNAANLLELEVLLVRQWGTLFPAGYNLTAGGGANLIVSDTTRSKMSAVRLGMKFSPSHVAAMRAVTEGRGHSDATRAKMSATRAGSRHTTEWNENSRVAAIKRGISKENRERMTMGRKRKSKEDIAAGRAAYLAANKARTSVRHAEYYLANREKILARVANYRASIRANKGQST